MLKHCGNYVAILTYYASFLCQKCFSDSPKDIYCRSQNMNNQKCWYTPNLLRIDISAFREDRLLRDIE